MKYYLLNSSVFLVFCLIMGLSLKGQEMTSTKIWEEDLTLPTYQVDPPEKCPMFFKNDSYQGASRKSIPIPWKTILQGRKGKKPTRPFT